MTVRSVTKSRGGSFEVRVRAPRCQSVRVSAWHFSPEARTPPPSLHRLHPPAVSGKASACVPVPVPVPAPVATVRRHQPLAVGNWQLQLAITPFITVSSHSVDGIPVDD